jgi:hypothetical protein
LNLGDVQFKSQPGHCLDWGFLQLSSVLQANAWIVPQLGYDCFHWNGRWSSWIIASAMCQHHFLLIFIPSRNHIHKHLHF